MKTNKVFLKDLLLMVFWFIVFGLITMMFMFASCRKAPQENQLPPIAIAVKGNTVIPFSSTDAVNTWLSSDPIIIGQVFSLNESGNAMGTNVFLKRILVPGASGIFEASILDYKAQAGTVNSLMTEHPIEYWQSNPIEFGLAINNYQFYLSDTLTPSEALVLELSHIAQILTNATGYTGFTIFPLAVNAFESGYIVHRYGIVSEDVQALQGSIRFNTVGSAAFQPPPSSISGFCDYDVQQEVSYVAVNGNQTSQLVTICDLTDYGASITFKIQGGL